MSEKIKSYIEEGEAKKHEPVPPDQREKVISLILKNNPRMEEHTKLHMMNQMMRNGRWGTCVDCPDAEGKPGGDVYILYPENCPNTDRSDHWLGVEPEEE